MKINYFLGWNIPVPIIKGNTAEQKIARIVS